MEGKREREKKIPQTQKEREREEETDREIVREGAAMNVILLDGFIGKQTCFMHSDTNTTWPTRNRLALYTILTLP